MKKSQAVETRPDQVAREQRDRAAPRALKIKSHIKAGPPFGGVG